MALIITRREAPSINHCLMRASCSRHDGSPEKYEGERMQFDGRQENGRRLYKIRERGYGFLGALPPNHTCILNFSRDPIPRKRGQ